MNDSADLLALAAQRQRAAPLRVPVGVIGPGDATPAQQAVACEIGRGVAAMGLALLCGGRGGVMEAACRGVREGGGVAIGLLPGDSPDEANAHVGVVLATGLGEARNVVIARAALCLVAVGDNLGTLSEVALGLRFGKRVVGLQGAARVEGVVHVDSAQAALAEIARCVLAQPR